MITKTIERRETHVFNDENFKFKLTQTKLEDLRMKFVKKPNSVSDKIYGIVQKQIKKDTKEPVDGTVWETACKEIFDEVMKMVQIIVEEKEVQE